MSGNVKNGKRILDICLAVVFLFFVFSYVYFFQADLLTLAQHVWSGGKTHYNPLVGAVLFTVALFIIRGGVRALYSLPSYMKALTYFPSMLFLGVITSVSPDNDSMSVGHWWWISSLILVVFFIVLKPFTELSSIEEHSRKAPSLFRNLWINMTIMALMMFMVFGIGNTDRRLHERLRMESLVASQRYDDALTVRQYDRERDPAMTMMRAYALSKKGQLGEKFFNYPVVASSQALLPTVEGSAKTKGSADINGSASFAFTPSECLWRNLGAAPRGGIGDVKRFLYNIKRCGLAKPATDDYILMAHLLDRDLNAFVKEVISRNDTLPADSAAQNLAKMQRHYREALVLYTHTHSNRLLTFTDEVLDADYEDFIALSRKKYKSPAERLSVLQDSYGSTYWFYYTSFAKLHL